MQATDRPAAIGRRLRSQPTRQALLALAVLGLGCALPRVAAAQFGDFLKSVAPLIPTQRPKPAPAPDRSSTTTSSNAPQPVAMSMQAGTALPPLHRLGTDAVAVVDAATPKAPVREMDYVFAKQQIALGPAGKITLSYLSGCLTESIQGGVVTVGLGGSAVTGGKHQEKTTPGCRAAHPIILASASEAGATVNRLTPFTGANWDERALKSALPVFKWDKGLGVTSLQLKDMDKDGNPVIWQVAVNGQDYVVYPVKTAPLAPGAPYRVEALAGGSVVAGALFSIDPALDVADNLANRVVPLSAP